MGGFGTEMALVVLGAVLLLSGLKIIREYERAVIFRLGRLLLFLPGVRHKGPHPDDGYTKIIWSRTSEH
jgi:regulator of protease activity HflC (stomatin/prohibitin superfamily)